MCKKYLEILIAFIVLQFLLMIRLLIFLRLGSSFHHFEHVIKQETYIFTKMIINFRFYQNFTKKILYQIFLKIHKNLRNVTNSKTFYQIWSHCNVGSKTLFNPVCRVINVSKHNT